MIDASGRGSRTAAWLASAGYAAPFVERVEVGMRYASRGVRRVPRDLDGRLFFSVSPSAGRPRACGVLAQEDGCWIVTMIGYFGDQPPLDEAGFLEFARGLPAPEVGNCCSEPSHWGRFARLPLRPTSVCITNA